MVRQLTEQTPNTDEDCEMQMKAPEILLLYYISLYASTTLNFLFE